MPKIATPSSVPAPRLMKAQSCRWVRAAIALSQPPATATARAARIRINTGVTVIGGIAAHCDRFAIRITK
jgi:hypothetical protein